MYPLSDGRKKATSWRRVHLLPDNKLTSHSFLEKVREAIAVDAWMVSGESLIDFVSLDYFPLIPSGYDTIISTYICVEDCYFWVAIFDII